MRDTAGVAWIAGNRDLCDGDFEPYRLPPCYKIFHSHIKPLLK